MSDILLFPFVSSNSLFYPALISMLLFLCSLSSVRCGAVCSLQQLEQQVEDIVKVYEARLTEKETTSLDPAIVQEDSSALQVHSAAVCVDCTKSIYFTLNKFVF